MRPSDLRIPIGYPNNDASNAAGMVQGDYGANNRVTFAVLVGLDTFSRCLPEFQRRYVAMMVACEVETGKSMGVGTAWRSEAQQAANHLRWPNQFAPVESSYHMRVPLTNTTLAADVVPGDVWPWMHANCHRFGFIHLTKNEQHHIQLVELPRSRSTYNQNPASNMAKVESRLLPYVGALSLAEFLARDEPLTVDGPGPPATDPPPHTDPPEPLPLPLPLPTPELPAPDLGDDDDMFSIAGKTLNPDGTIGAFRIGNGRTSIVVGTGLTAQHEAVNARFGGMVDAKTASLQTRWGGINALPPADLDRICGKVA